MASPNRPKVKGECYCIYCNGTCNPYNDEFVITKRKQLNWFHKSCYFKYKVIDFDLVSDQEDSSVKD